jgi:branched-chain amino acid transport system substrate-binding protein
MKKTSRLFLAALVLSCTSAGAAPPEEESQATQTVLIGFAAPFNWILPLHSMRAAQQAVNDANRQDLRIDGRKLQFQLMSDDDKSDPRVAKFIAKSFVKAGVTAVVGHWNTDTTLATAPIYAAADVVQITTSATAEQITRQGYPGIFQLLGNDDTSAQCVIDYVVKTMQAKRIALIADGTAFGKNLALEYSDKLKELNGRVVIYESVSSKTSDFNAPLKKIRDAGADVVLFSGSLLHSGDLARAMKRLQVPAKLFLPGGSTGHTFLNMTGGDLGDVLTIEPGSQKERSPKWKQFQADYQKAPAWEVSPYSILTYDAVSLIVKAIRHGNSTDPKKVAEVLHKIRFEGLSGKIAFDSTGARVDPLYTVYAYEAHKWTALKTYGN